MTSNQTPYHEQSLNELRQIPIEHLSSLLTIVRAYRESLSLPLAEESFSRGWEEIAEGKTRPIQELWEDIDAE